MATAADKAELARLSSGASPLVHVIEVPKLSESIAQYMPRAAQALRDWDEKVEVWRKSIFFGEGSRTVQVAPAVSPQAASGGTTVITETAAHKLLSVTHLDTLPADVVTGDLIYGNATPRWARFPHPGEPDKVLVTDSSTTIAWGQVSLANSTTGTLSVPRGGTGATSFTAYTVITAGTTSTNPLQSLPDGVGTSGYVLTSNGAGTWPTWQAGISGAVNLGSGTAVWLDKSGTNLRFRTLLAGANITLTVTGSNEIQIASTGGGATPTNPLLDAMIHTDTAAAGPTRGSLVYGSSVPLWDELVIGAANRLLRSDGTDISWAQAVLTTDVTGTLPVANGGTGVTSLSDVLGTTNQVNVSGGTARVIGGNVTLSLPQSINTGATPTFAGLTLTGLSAGLVVFTGVGGLLSVEGVLTYDSALDTLSSINFVGTTSISTPQFIALGVTGLLYADTATNVIFGAGALAPLYFSEPILGILGLSDVGTANQIPGTNAGATAWEYKTLIAGANVTITNGVGTITIASAGGISAHTLLDGSAHTDTVAQTVSTGSLVYGNATPKWDELVIGSSGTFLRSNGTVPSWQSITAADVTAGQALTRTNDTNVTVTLGGSPTTCLLAAASLTLGWTGVLSLARGGSNKAITAVAGAVVWCDADSFELTAAGTSGQILVSAGTGSPVWQDPSTATAHNILSATHSDTLAASVARGDVIVGNSTPKWARLAIGTTGKFLGSDGTDASWQTIAANQIGSGAALTKVDDTNVTLTLGGSPTVALLAATSLTLGWTGTLAIARGGTASGTALGAFNNLSPLTTRGDLLTRDASNNVRLAIGTTGKFLKSDGTDASWQSITAAVITSGAALTRVNGTNVTLTLGGSPTTALLAATSITVGWTGQLAVADGGTGAASFTQGSVIFMGASALSEDNTNFFWDIANDRLGIRTSTPSVALTVVEATTVVGAMLLTRPEHTSTLPSAFALHDSTAQETVGFTSWDGGGGTGGYGVVVLSSTGASAIRLGEISGRNNTNGFRVCDIIYQTGSAADNGEIVVLLGAGGGSFAYAQYIGANGTSFKSSSAPTAKVHIAAGATAASSAPLKFTTGTSMTTAESGAVEYTTDDLFFTISTGAARKRFVFADPVGGLTSGRVPFATTNGRLTDSANMTFSTATLTVNTLALTNPLTVPNGGTGAATFTAFAVICAGTTATGAFQNVSGLGSSGQVLTSNGAGALPTWQAAASPTHNLLSATHSDTTAAAVVRGDIITGQAASPLWKRLAIGTSGQFVRSDGTDVAWSSGFALTKTDDTNVTLTLGGTPTTALLVAASLTLGWTGSLAVARGGTGNTTFTAYSVLCAGTTATGAFQNVSGVGTAGQVLTSNGAGALPSWQAASSSGGYRRLNTQFGPVGNSAATETTLFTYTIPGGTLAANKDALIIHVAGNMAAEIDSGTKRLQAYFDGNVVFTSGFSVGSQFSALGWTLRIVIFRDASNSQKISTDLLSEANLWKSSDFADGGSTDASDIIVKVTGVADSLSGVVGEIWAVHFSPHE